MRHTYVDHPMSAGRANLFLITQKRTFLNVDFAVAAFNKLKINWKLKSWTNIYIMPESWKKQQLWNRKVTVVPIAFGVSEIVPKNLQKKKRGRIGDQTKNRDDPDLSTVNISLNTKMNCGELKRLVTWISLINHPVKLMWKTCRVKIIR